MDFLDDNERKSPLWVKIEQYLNERLQSLREKNDQPTDHEKTTLTRGGIIEIKSLLSKGKEKPKHNASGVDYS